MLNQTFFDKMGPFSSGQLNQIMTNCSELDLRKADTASLDSIEAETQYEFSYNLGDLGKEEHIRTFKQLDAKLLAIGQLAENDFAFVQQSKGIWQYSMVIEAPAEVGFGKDRRVKFQVDSKGQTKTIPFCQWAEFIELVKSQPVQTKHAPRRASSDSLEEDIYSRRPEDRKGSGHHSKQDYLSKSQLPLLIAAIASQSNTAP